VHCPSLPFHTGTGPGHQSCFVVFLNRTFHAFFPLFSDDNRLFVGLELLSGPLFRGPVTFCIFPFRVCCASGRSYNARTTMFSSLQSAEICHATPKIAAAGMESSHPPCIPLMSERLFCKVVSCPPSFCLDSGLFLPSGQARSTSYFNSPLLPALKCEATNAALRNVLEIPALPIARRSLLLDACDSGRPGFSITLFLPDPPLTCGVF